jgi:hypothetical protein
MPVPHEFGSRRIARKWGSLLWQEFMDELRVAHLGESTRPGRSSSVMDRLRLAYLDALGLQALKAIRLIPGPP